MKTALTDNWLVCRVCLKPSQDDMLRIFNEDEVQDLTQMMLECGGIPIKRFDHYPDKICQKCYKYLRVAYKFRITCQRSHNHLSKMIAPVQVEAKDEQSNEDWETEVGVEIDEAGDETPKMDILAIKEELGAIEEHSGDETNDVVDVYEPMDDDIEANEAAFEELDSIQRMQENDDDDDIKDLEDDDDDVIKDIEDDEIKDIDDPQANDVKEDEYYDDFMADVTTSDEEFLPTKRGGPKRGYQKRVAPTKTTSPHRKRVKGEAAKAPKDQPVEKKKRGPKPKEPTTYICDMCGNIYPTQGRLNEHLKLHKGVKPHVCEICGHAFAQTQQLARHMNTHTGNRPFKCSFCPAAFADLSTRNKHHRIHTNERPYVCDVCGKSFTYTNTLKFHKMIHTGEKPHVCDICGKGFMQAYKMRNHRAIHLKKGIKLQRLEVEQVTHFNEATEGAVLEICAQ